MASSTSRTCSSLPEDILIEIFAYLTLNLICKFKCLSKVWLSNLSSPNFIIKWFHINNKSLPWIHYHTLIRSSKENALRFKMAYPDSHSEFMSRNEHLFSFKFLINQKPFQDKTYLLGSSNGLVLYQTIHSGGQSKYHVCNPLTQKWVSLPSPPSWASPFDCGGIFCDYAPSFTSCYKVVRIPVFRNPSKKFIVDIFSSDSGAWDSNEVSCDENVVWDWSYFNNVVLLNGVLFWIQGLNRMLAYNFNQKIQGNRHRCCLINFPVEDFRSIFLGETEGQVCCAGTRRTGLKTALSVWVLDELNWQILHKDISVDFSKVLGFSPVDRNVVLLGWKDCVWGFNMKTRILEELCLDNRNLPNAGTMFQPFVLKPMPTVLPPTSWIDA